MEFQEFKKIPRIFRDCIITEKIDGTNGQILIERVIDPPKVDGNTPVIPLDSGGPVALTSYMDSVYAVWAGSRNRWLSPTKSLDNHGFASWVTAHASDLVGILGEGRHYGEWWGSGIQRGYGLTQGDKRFSLFNVDRWKDLPSEGPGSLVYKVPVLYEGPFRTSEVDACLELIRRTGSRAVPGYMKAEGVVVYHVAAGSYFKATVENDEKPKGQDR